MDSVKFLNQDFTIKYFTIEDSSADPQQKEQAKKVHVQVEANMTREQYDKLFNSGKKSASNLGKKLMLFNDKSGSMSGGPFRTLKEGCMELKNQIFPSDSSTNPFETVEVIFYSNKCDITQAKNEEIFSDIIEHTDVGGGTNFSACFDVISKTVDKCRLDDEVAMVFFTDGEDTASRGNIHHKLD